MQAPRKHTIKEKGAALRLRLSDRWSHFREEMRHPRRLVVMDPETLKEKLSLQLTGTNLFVGIGTAIIVLILITGMLIAFTPLHNLIPGYINDRAVEQSYENARTIDSLEQVIHSQQLYIEDIQAIIDGRPLDTLTHTKANAGDKEMPYRHTQADTLLLKEMGAR